MSGEKKGQDHAVPCTCTLEEKSRLRRIADDAIDAVIGPLPPLAQQLWNMMRMGRDLDVPTHESEAERRYRKAGYFLP